MGILSRETLLEGMRKFGGSDSEICRNTLGISPEEICENIVISPGWTPDRLFPAESIRKVIEATPLFRFQLWTVDHEGCRFTWVKAGFGAPMVMDALILLGLTGRCKKVLFVSSVGGLDPGFGVGDLLIPEYSVSGDGACRYLTDDLADCFGEHQLPDRELFLALHSAAGKICRQQDVSLHMGHPFCTDTIAAQYGHLDRIAAMGYDCLDMESAAAFKAAGILGIRIAALLNVSDNSSASGKSLMNTRSGKEQDYQRFVTRKVMPKIVTDVFQTDNI
ncbi:MAG: phosphorylase [Oscillospiraceae bacterium]|nr:phosphorylase [Oscillospiraceae bacterium]